MPDQYEYEWVDIAQEITRLPVDSSNLMEVGYRRDPGSHMGTLEIKFHGKPNNPGRVYQYYDVPWQRVKAFLEAPSLGEYHARNIKFVYYYAEVTGWVP